MQRGQGSGAGSPRAACFQVHLGPGSSRSSQPARPAPAPGRIGSATPSDESSAHGPRKHLSLWPFSVGLPGALCSASPRWDKWAPQIGSYRTFRTRGPRGRGKAGSADLGPQGAGGGRAEVVSRVSPGIQPRAGPAAGRRRGDRAPPPAAARFPVPARAGEVQPREEGPARRGGRGTGGLAALGPAAGGAAPHCTNLRARAGCGPRPLPPTPHPRRRRRRPGPAQSQSLPQGAGVRGAPLRPQPAGASRPPRRAPGAPASGPRSPPSLPASLSPPPLSPTSPTPSLRVPPARLRARLPAPPAPARSSSSPGPASRAPSSPLRAGRRLVMSGWRSGSTSGSRPPPTRASSR